MTPPPPNFDRVAGIYRWAEYLSLGPLLVRTRNHFLPQIVHCRRALVLGDGDGRFLARLLQQNPDLHALAVDTSAKMLHRLRQRCLRTTPRCVHNLRCLKASALEITPSRDTDLIVTHFLLDCFPQSEVDALAQRIAAQVPAGTLWLLSDFAVPDSPLLRPLAATYVRSLYFAFRLLTGLRNSRLPDPQAALARSGFRRIARHERLFGLLYTELWQRQ
jgi:ubiquinone/menaquinone biosynthesis C-methylase UbiE